MKVRGGRWEVERSSRKTLRPLFTAFSFFPRERTGDEVLRTSAWKANLTEILSVAVKV